MPDLTDELDAMAAEMKRLLWITWDPEIDLIRKAAAEVRRLQAEIAELKRPKSLWEKKEAADQFPEPDVDDDSYPLITDHLIMDHEVSETSPVVKGTWVTASHVVSLIVDGYTWSDVLRAHPELTEDDVRACLAWAIEKDVTERGEPDA